MHFTGFSADSFEQLIRALSLKTLGPGVTVFGNGPDGGREATFKGKISFPHPPSSIWEGYGVIQAKFKEKIEDTQTEQVWAERQLSAELKRWSKSEKRSPKPDYYIFCTNVDLTSASNGGRALLEKVFKKYESILGIRDYAIWDGNQLRSFMDGSADLRKRFTCLFTPGDLLAEFANVLTRVPNPDAILTAYLCKEILADEDARLSQAGDRSEDRIRLANVFVDLPVGTQPCAEPIEETDADDVANGSLPLLLRSCSRKLDPLTIHEQRSASGTQDGDVHDPCSRFVFLGGPGSGKSTIGQFLAQIHRAALLSRRPAHRLEYSVRNVIEGIKVRCDEEKAIFPSTPRYPFRVELNAFAKALAAGQDKGVSSLSEWLRRSLSVDFALTHEDLRQWLRAFPWLLVLDGLDEVPASSNRREVVAAIQSFLSEARDLEADLMIVASSRPDGYAGEFDGDEVTHYYLSPLSKTRALGCAKRYVNAKAASKGDHRTAESFGILKSAIDNPLIARLMRSPLQVTFMVTVVAASGKPSDSRWQLFNDYYRTIYERELHKAVRPFDRVLSERRQDIDALHHRVGFILQCRAESSGGTAAQLTIDEFDKILTECLEENGLAPQELEKQKEMIIGAANQRLVFLTSKSPGKLSFEVRSLQEYMAAACITNADSSEVIQRIDRIAHSAYWRNTFLFAVGRFFVEPQMRSHRDKIRVLCEDLNLGDPDRAAAKLGSRMALAILESGTIGNVPLMSRSLAACSLLLLDIPPHQEEGISKRIAGVYDPSLEKEFEDAIRLRLGQREPSRALAAWLLVFYLEQKGVVWAAAIAANNWSQADDAGFLVLETWLSDQDFSSVTQKCLSKGDTIRLSALIPLCSIKNACQLLDLGFVQVSQPEATWLSHMLTWYESGGSVAFKVLAGESSSGLVLRVRGLPGNDNGFEQICSHLRRQISHSDWAVFCGLCEFYRIPSAESVAQSLVHLANASLPQDWEFWSDVLPWPLASCLNANSNREGLLKLADGIRTRWKSEVDVWIGRESSWQEDGITLEELWRPVFPNGPALINAVRQASVESAESGLQASFTKTMLEFAAQIPVIEERSPIAWIFAFYATARKTWLAVDPSVVQDIILPARKRWSHLDFVLVPAGNDVHREAWVRFYDHLGRLSDLRAFPIRWRLKDAPVQMLRESFQKDTSKIGLLRLLAFWCSTGAKIEFNNGDLRPFETFPDKHWRFATALLQLSQATLNPSEAERLANVLAELIGGETDSEAREILFEMISNHGKEIPPLGIVLRRLSSFTPASEWRVHARVEKLRSALMETVPSGLDTPVLQSLRLPYLRPC